MEKLLVLIQHDLTPAQLEELKEYEIVYLRDCAPQLFAQIANSPDDIARLHILAEHLLEAVKIQGAKTILRPLGSPAFNSVLDRHLDKAEYECDYIRSLFSHSERISVDEPQADGSVVKKSVFKHVKFIEI